jgi:hypothetical protein
MANSVSAPQPAEKQVFGSLRIDRLVLETPSRTIAIRNISTISVGTVVHEKSVGWLIFGIGCWLAIAAMGLTGGRSWQGDFNPFAILLGPLGLVCLVYWLAPNSSEHYLIISSNDGTRSLFTGPQRDTLHQVRRLLTEKINTENVGATWNVNFQNGAITNLTAEAGATVVHGSNNHVVQGSPGARVGSPGDTISVSQSPGAQVGTGNVSQGNTFSIGRIDYSAVTPTIGQWRDFYAAQPEHAELVQRRTMVP